MVFVSVLISKRDARAQSNLTSNDAVAPKQVSFLVEHVHGTALSFARSCAASVQFRHDKFRIRTQHQWVCVVTVSRNHAVGRADGFRDACKDGFLSNVQVTETTKLLLDIKLSTAFFKLAHQVHVAEPPLVYFLRMGY